jgi:ubiquinone/menaquinone biosynthesis C-methylase UbiE
MAKEGNNIPFNNDSFDFVINNQVMEHVEDIDAVLAEIKRVLKPGGVVLSLFPDKCALREVHSGIPLLHWFPKYSRIRVYYAVVFRIIGLGSYKKNKGIIYWSQQKCDWLDKWTYYRTQKEIHLIYGKYFVELQHIEDYWLQQRLAARKIVPIWLPSFAQKLVVRKLGSMVFTARKPHI